MDSGDCGIGHLGKREELRPSVPIRRLDRNLNCVLGSGVTILAKGEGTVCDVLI